MRSNGPVARSPQSSRGVAGTPETTNLADLLERVLDKGIVIAGDITLSLGTVEVLTLKIRLLVASVDKAQEIGINWWQSDPFLSSRAREQDLAARPRAQALEGERDQLTERIDRLERLLLASPQKANQEHSVAGQQINAAPADVLDKEGMPVAELKPPVQQAQQEEQSRGRTQEPQSQAPERAPQQGQQRQLEAEQTAPQRQEAEQPHGRAQQAESRVQQPEAQSQASEHAQQAPEVEQEEQQAGAGQVVREALQEQIAQAPRQVEEARPEGQQGDGQPQEAEQPRAPQPAQQWQEAEQPRVQQPQTAQAEQPAAAGSLLGQALQQQIARALQPVLGELQQRIAQTPPQQMEQVRQEGQRGKEPPQGEQAQEAGQQSRSGKRSSKRRSKSRSAPDAPVLPT